MRWLPLTAAALRPPAAHAPGPAAPGQNTTPLIALPRVHVYIHGMLSHRLLMKHSIQETLSQQLRLVHETRMLFVAPVALTSAHDAANHSTSTCARSSSTAPRCATSVPPGRCEIVCFLPGGGPSPRRSTMSSQNSSKHVACACAAQTENNGEVESPLSGMQPLQRHVCGIAFH